MNSFLHSALSIAAIFIWSIELPDKKVKFSDSIKNILGYNPSDLDTLQKFGELIHPSDYAGFFLSLDQYLAGAEDIFYYEYRVKNSEGEYKWFRIKGKTEQNENGKTVIAGAATDITHEKLKEKELNNAKAQFKLIAENTSDGIIVFEKEHIVFVSDSYTRQLGYSEDEEVGRDSAGIFELIHPEDRGIFNDIYAAIGEKEESLLYMYRARCKNGDYIWREDHANFFYDENGDYVRSIVVARDVTFRVEATAKLEAAKNKAQELARLKSSLLNNMSHELRTPLIGILGYAEIMAEEAGQESERVMANRIFQGGKRLIRTINLILEYSRMESENYRVKAHNVNLEELFYEMREMFLPEAAKKNLKLEINVQKDLQEIFSNKVLLENIFMNLIDNAIKFTIKGGVTVSVNTTDDTTGTRELILKVTDTGIGIDEGNFDLIFDEFRQVSEGMDRHFEGSGLGLTLTKKWIEKLGGSITLESHINSGTTVSVFLPYHTSEQSVS